MPRTSHTDMIISKEKQIYILRQMGKRMRKKLIAYLKELDKKEYLEMTTKEIEDVKKELLIQIQFFQHERMIHLIVTALFAILEVLSLLICVIDMSIFSSVLCGLFFILLIPYIYHYYLLENGVQEMYKWYDHISNEIKDKEVNK